MKKFDVLKTFQLICFIIMAAICALVIIFNKDLFHIIATDAAVRLLGILLWLILAIAFLFTFLDFSFFGKFKRDYSELDYAVHSDPLAGIANRYSSDVIIEKYLDKELPDSIGCIMIELTNIQEINRLYGHIEGNALIRNFSTILKITSVNLCFVARNGGNKFLAIFEDCTEEKITTFMERVQQKVSTSNSEAGTHPIKFDYGVAFHEGGRVKGITELIALANRRISAEGDGRYA